MSDNQQRRTVYAIGECMVELSHSQQDEYRRAFAGDVYNTAVYLRRLAPVDCDVEFISAIGDDAMSAAMQEAWTAERVSSTHFPIIAGKSPGLYFIHTDEAGERCFSYWRRQSAASLLTAALESLDAKALREGDIVYFSGITIAILDEDNRSMFFEFVEKAKSAGVVIAFDPNYRPALWQREADAVDATMRAYLLSDIVFSSADEDRKLFGWPDEKAGRLELSRLGVKEIIIKSGERGVFGATEHGRFHIPFSPAEKVVDTTAAGDSFAGAYLAFRLHGNPPDVATANAARVARIVVSHRGAIIDAARMDAEMKSDALLREVVNQ